ncbi:MAG: branched-chain amino acid ABC transporter ATP-binding protein/permease [Burkholderiales bacterium]|nr:branched-chain amino acid ABC transporter ATP-binding protein/permease [Burkholderiales bacterium]
MNSLRAISSNRAAALVFGAAVLAYPLVFSGRFEIGAAVAVGAMAIGAIGFVLLIGYAHQLALGQAAFCMIGGYGSALLTTRYGADPFVAMIVSMALSGLVAWAIGRPILKLRGYSLAMASLALQLMLVFLAIEMASVTGGAEGVPGVPKFALFGWRLEGDISYFYLVWLLVAFSLAFGLNVVASRIGRALKAIGASEVAAASVGIDITHYKVQMFVASAAMASVTGSLTAHYLRIMEPHVFGFVFSLNIITAVIVGGLHSIWGGMLGAVVLVALREGLRALELPTWEVVIMGGLTVLVLMLFRQGLAGALAAVYRRLCGAAPEATAVAPPPVHLARDATEERQRPESGDLEIDRASKSFGNLRAVHEVSFTVKSRSITALIGPNGAGKTTLFNLVCGSLPLDSGEIRFRGRRIDQLAPHRLSALGIARTFQNVQLFTNMSVLENVMCGRHRHARAGIVRAGLGLPQIAEEERGLREHAMQWLEFAGIAQAAAMSTATLPLGHQRLVEIARALASEPALLLMDEPASGLNDSETESLARLILRIRALGITVLLVEHDVRLVMGLAEHVVVMSYGEKIAEGSPAQVRASPQVISAYLGTA